jgi:hypothetical protein
MKAISAKETVLHSMHSHQQKEKRSKRERGTADDELFFFSTPTTHTIWGSSLDWNMLTARPLFPRSRITR